MINYGTNHSIQTNENPNRGFLYEEKKWKKIYWRNIYAHFHINKWESKLWVLILWRQESPFIQVDTRKWRQLQNFRQAPTGPNDPKRRSCVWLFTQLVWKYAVNFVVNIPFWNNKRLSHTERIKQLDKEHEIMEKQKLRLLPAWLTDCGYLHLPRVVCHREINNGSGNSSVVRTSDSWSKDGNYLSPHICRHFNSDFPCLSVFICLACLLHCKFVTFNRLLHDMALISRSIESLIP